MNLLLAKNLIDKSRNILIIPSQDLQADILGSGLALFYSLKEIGKDANIFLKQIPSKFQFLTDDETVRPQKFAISVALSGREILEMEYKKNEGDLKIEFILKGKSLEPKDVVLVSPAASPGCLPADGIKPLLRAEPFNPASDAEFALKPDLLIILGAKNFEDLGDFFEKNPQLFYNTPILNIDNGPDNENFGEVNLVLLKSCSVSEIVADLIKLLGESLVDEKAATCLLAGIISATQNFQNPRIRPQVFETVSYLLEKGGNHQKIVQRLYKTKSLSQVQLLGLILGKLKFSKEKDLYSVCLKEEDFSSVKSAPKDLVSIIEDLKFNFWASISPAPNFLVLWESHCSPPAVRGIFCSSDLNLISKILERFEGISKRNGSFFLIRETDLDVALQKVFNVL